MAQSFDIVNRLQARLRDVHKFAYPDADVVRVVDHVQRILNASEHFVPVTNFAVNIPANRTLFTLAEFAPFVDAGTTRVVRVAHQNRILPRVPWRSLVHEDPGWLRTTGTRIEVYATIGLDLFVLYPAVPAPTQVALTFVFPPSPLTNTSGDEDMTIPAETIPLLQDLCETVLTVRGRRAGEGADPLDRVRAMLTAFTAHRGDAQDPLPST